MGTGRICDYGEGIYRRRKRKNKAIAAIMKKQLKNIIKTTKPIKGKISDMVKAKLSRKEKNSKLNVIPSSLDLPTESLDRDKQSLPKAVAPINNEIQDSSKGKTRELGSVVDSIKSLVKNTVNQNTNIHNRHIHDHTKNITNNSSENVFNKNGINKTNNSINSIENVFNKNDMNSLIHNFSSMSNSNSVSTETKPNYIKESISIPFVAKDKTPNSIEPTTPSDSSKNIKVSRPQISNFSNITNPNSAQFSKQSKFFTNKVNNVLGNSPSIRVFTSKGHVTKSTREVMNHIKARQNNIVPMLEYGGVVNSPTLAMIGEAGPESVQPLTPGKGMPENSTSSPGVHRLTDNIVPPIHNQKPKNMLGKIDNKSNDLASSLGTKKEHSIASLTNDTLKERSSYESQIAANTMKASQQKPESEPMSIRMPPSGVASSQTAPGGSSPGAEAGSNGFEKYFRARMFSLPDWRTRLS